MLELEKKYLGLAGITIKRTHKNSIDFPCPICGDSKNNKFKARGSLSDLEGNAIYHCYNCEFSGSFATFLGAVDMTLKDGYLRETGKVKREQFINRKNELDVFSKPTDVKPELPTFDPSEIAINEITYKVADLTLEAKDYLRFRKIREEDFKNFKSLPDMNAIVAFLRLNSKVFGFQVRSISGKFYHNHVEDGFDKCWNVDHILSLPIGTTVYVFESIFNALSTSSNSVMASLGSSMSTALQELLKQYRLVFCFDNDVTGIKKTIQFTLKGYEAVVHHDSFIWGDYNEAREQVSDVQLQGYIEACTMSSKMANLKLRLKK